MLITIPKHLQERELLKNIDGLSYAKYVQCDYQEKNELDIESNVLIFVTKGKKILHLPFGDVIIDVGDVLFLKSGHYVVSEVLDESYEALLFFYSDELLINFMEKYELNRELKKKQKDMFLLQKNRQLESAILSVVPYFEQNKDENTSLIKLKFEEIFLNILHSKDAKEFQDFLSSLSSQNSLLKIKIEQELHHLSSVSEMAQELKMSEVVLRRKFQEIFASTPKKWLLKKKLQKAKLLLKNSSLNVTQVSQEVGFDDLSWFTQSFKKEFAKTPKEYKNNKT